MDLQFVAHSINDWCRFNGSGSLFIDPGSPWQNGWIESFNARLRDEFLNGQHFDSMLEAKVLLSDWRHESNHEQIHSALVRQDREHQESTMTGRISGIGIGAFPLGLTIHFSGFGNR